jgi:hypothetical protein
MNDEEYYYEEFEVSADPSDILVDSYMQLAERASDLAYARRSLYLAYLAEGFSEEEALNLCKDL